jgi:hypothetical protein
MKLHFRICPDHTIRIWRDDWAGDQFNVLTPIAWQRLEQKVNEINESIRLIEIVDHTDED